MLLVYVGALLVSIGMLAVQILGGGDHDVTGGGHEIAHDAAHETAMASALAYVASVRFWAFGLLAFGLVGTLVTAMRFAAGAVAATVATGAGLLAGFVAVTVLRRMMTRPASSHATASDVVGKVGRVIVPPNEAGRCKVRVEIKGAQVDYVGRASEPLAEGDAILVEDTEGAELTVSRAPRELER